MLARNDQLAFGAVQVAAPVGNDAVAAHRFGAVEVSSLTPIPDNGVEGNSLVWCQGIHRL